MSESTEVVARPFDDEPAPLARSAATEIAMARAAQEVQVAVVMAKKFPRDEQASFRRIMKACARRSLAEQACYEFPRGGQKVTGPSIRLAEVLAQNWGNFQSGWTEVSRRQGESDCLAFAWDLETNVRQTRDFTVKHWRDTKGGGYALSDERDIYELLANQSARRVRACILAMIPGDIVEAAERECDKTLAGKNAEPLSDRIRALLVDFEKLQVTTDMINARLGFPVEKVSEQHFAALLKVHNSIRDGFGKRGDFFKPPTDAATEKPRSADELAAKLSKKATRPELSDEEKRQIEEEDRRNAGK